MSALLSFAPSGLQTAWDATSLAAFEKCPRYYYFRHIKGWQPINRSVHLTFGGIYASSLEHYHKHVAAGMTKQEATRLVLRQAMVDTWIYPADPEDGPGTPWESFHNAKTRDTLLRSIIWYLDQFADDNTPTVILSDGTPAVEYSFTVPFTKDYLYCGHIDRLVEYSGGIYVMDQKTTGSTLTAKFFSNFTPDIQMSGYTWAGKIIFNLPVSGVIIDAAQIAVGFTRFERGFIHRPQSLLDEWYENSLTTIEAAKAAHESNHYRMNRTACGNFGGCEFRKICSRAPEHRDNILAAEFTRETQWDPLQRR